jgi:hypothetical protein
MDLISDQMEKAKIDQRMISLASDSTTRDRVGKFNVSGVHLGKDLVLPLPTLSVTTETIKEVAEASAMPLELLAAASGKVGSEIYKMIDCHVSDSVSHNKHISEELSKKYDRDLPAGQVFCNVHTALGLMSSMNKRYFLQSSGPSMCYLETI